MRKIAVALSAILVVVLFSTMQVEASSQATPETEVRNLLSRWQKMFEARDTESVMTLYAPGSALLAFDIIPPLEVSGRDAYRKNYESFFAQYEGPLTVEIRDLHVVADHEIAYIYCLEKVSGTLKGGQKSELWMRATSGLRKIHGKWLIVHDHISVPVDFESGKAKLDAIP